MGSQEILFESIDHRGKRLPCLEERILNLVERDFRSGEGLCERMVLFEKLGCKVVITKGADGSRQFYFIMNDIFMIGTLVNGDDSGCNPTSLRECQGGAEDERY